MILSSSGGGESNVATKPLVGIGMRVKMGGMILMPEANYMHAASVSGASEDGETSASIDMGLAAFGLGFTF